MSSDEDNFNNFNKAFTDVVTTIDPLESTREIAARYFISTEGDISEYTHILNTDTCEDCGDKLSPFWVRLHCQECDRFTNPPKVEA